MQMLGLLSAPRSAQGIFKTPDEIRIMIHSFSCVTEKMYALQRYVAAWK